MNLMVLLLKIYFVKYSEGIKEISHTYFYPVNRKMLGVTGRTWECIERKQGEAKFSLCFMSVLPHHSMFRNRFETQAMRENSFQNINYNKLNQLSSITDQAMEIFFL